VPGIQRDRLTAGIFIPTAPDEALGRLERAFRLAHKASPSLKAIKTASRNGQLPQGKPELLVDAALAIGALAEAEADLLREAAAARYDAIQVDAFSSQEYRHIGTGEFSLKVAAPPADHLSAVGSAHWK
jgi:acyl-CoA dehydrogenase